MGNRREIDENNMEWNRIESVEKTRSMEKKQGQWRRYRYIQWSIMPS